MGKVVKIKSKAKVISKIPAVKKIGPAIELPEPYLDMIKANPLNQKAYSRLMIIYRKLKQYRKELAIINKAIKTFTGAYRSKKTTNKKIQTISRQLNRQLGLTDSKGKTVFDLGPVAGWKKRKELLLERQSAAGNRQ